MTDKSNYKDVEHKLLILYLVNRIDVPMSNEQITECILETKFMDYYTMQETLAVMSESGLLYAAKESSQDSTITRYTITEEGITTLEYFEEHIPQYIRQGISRYFKENRRRIKKDYECVATYFYNEENDEYEVKCGVYDDGRPLLEFSVFVDTQDQAKLIRSNWLDDYSDLYRKIIEALTIKSGPKENDTPEQ